MLSCFHVFLVIFLHMELLEVAGTSCVWNHSCFLLLPHFAQAGKSFLVIISGWVSFPMFLLHFYHCFQTENRFLAMTSEGKKRTTILGVVESIFGHVRAKMFLEIELLLRGCFTHPGNSFFCFPNHFSSNPEIVLCCGCIFWIGPRWNWEWK